LTFKHDDEDEKLSMSKVGAHSIRCSSGGVVVINIQVGDCWWWSPIIYLIQRSCFKHVWILDDGGGFVLYSLHDYPHAYKLELPPPSHVHMVFHVSCLKKVIGDKIPIQTILPNIDEVGKIILEFETIIKTRIKQL